MTRKHKQAQRYKNKVIPISEDNKKSNSYTFMKYYGIMYDGITDAEKKEFMKTFIEEVEIYKEPLASGQLLLINIQKQIGGRLYERM